MVVDRATTGAAHPSELARARDGGASAVVADVAELRDVDGIVVATVTEDVRSPATASDETVQRGFATKTATPWSSAASTTSPCEVNPKALACG